MNRVVRATVVAVAVAGMLPATTLSAQAALPTVTQIYDKYAQAIGGRDAWAKTEGRTELGTVELAAAPLSGSYARYLAAPNRMRMTLDLGVVVIDQGFDGEKGWAAQGDMLQRMPAEQEKSLVETPQGGDSFLDPSHFAKAEVAGKDAFEGNDAYKVAITIKGGSERTDFFDINTGLLLGSDATSPAGTLRVVYKEYQVFDGKKVATQIIQKTAQGDVIIKINSVAFGAPGAEHFKAPDGLK